MRPEVDESEEYIERKVKKIFVAGEKEDMKFISKEAMDDIDLLVSIHNSLVIFIHNFSVLIIRL